MGHLTQLSDEQIRKMVSIDELSKPVPVEHVEDDGTRHYHKPGEIPLNPKIRKTVDLLRSLRFKTVDSGDGETHACGCDRDYAYVCIAVAPSKLVTETKRLIRELEKKGVEFSPMGTENKPQIQASFDPVDNTALIDVMYVNDDALGD